MRFHRFTGFVESIEGVLRCNRRYRVNGRNWLRWLHQLRAVGLIAFAMPHIPPLASVVSLRDPRHFVSQCGGEGGIRTPGALRLSGFQDRRDRPLCHLSVLCRR